MLGFAFASALVSVWLAFGVAGYYVAGQKRRSTAEGFWMGVLFGPLGVLIEALLPTITPEKPVRKSRPVDRKAWDYKPPHGEDPEEDEAFGFLTEKRPTA
jgi:hypothetical protein